MSVSKKRDMSQKQFFSQQNQAAEASQPERKALSLAWDDKRKPLNTTASRDADISHCAVLGYN
ncbi:hypothetical protein [Arsukibacterium sp.]|uniref:hypothetical protein n=1 Tax=Arsukibacterium sp. TaxID=1977258 RepID=UPI00299D037C|nr:hypothetical protein [Arsukibacterium sp.]MDX1678540.1 hypothetical protein [Arsukibacterium sp.]